MRQWTVYSSLAVYPIFLANLAHGCVLTTSIAAHPADATILGEAGEGEAPIYISAHSAEDRGPILSDSESKARQYTCQCAVASPRGASHGAYVGSSKTGPGGEEGR